MNQQFIMFRRAGVFYCEDTTTGKQTSLRTKDQGQALTLLHAKNESFRQPVLNRQIARAYLTASDPQIAKRSWQNVMDEIPKLKSGTTRDRWETAIKSKALDSLRDLPVLETQAQHFLRVLEGASGSTNSYLRRIHGFALDMDWLPWPILPRKRWPAIKFKEKRAITREEHNKILAGENNPEWHAFYQLLWYLGSAQTDMATLPTEDIDWADRTISYTRHKTGSVSLIRFGESVVEILQSRPQTGFLFPMIALWKQADRGKAFIRRCRLVGVSGVSLHCYRYAWAERARTCGYARTRPSRTRPPSGGCRASSPFHPEPIPERLAMNTTPNLPGLDEIIKPFKFNGQPYEYKVVSLRECPTPESLQLCDTPEKAADYWRMHVATNPYFNPECECFTVLLLNTRRRVKAHQIVSMGTHDTILVHPLTVFRLAVVTSAAALVLMHNHPSGESSPSEADIKVTRDLIRAGQLLKIEVLDHVIVGNPDHSSLRALGYFYQ